MVSESWIFQAIASGKTYDSFPSNIRSALSVTEWNTKVKRYCIQHGYSWGDSIAKDSSGEQEFYEELLEYYKKNERLFPYHLAHYVCRILRITSFRYYSDILFNSLKEEKAYDKIPNFTVKQLQNRFRHLAIGRNEYISILDACRAKKFIWRMNRNIAKERLPNAPVSSVMEPWWKVGVVNVDAWPYSEFRALTPEELEFLQKASEGNSTSLAAVNYEMLRSLYNRGLVYLRIPIREDDKFKIPPLEGFISNRNVSSNVEGGVDPMDTLLYSVFIANSETMTLSALAQVLNVSLPDLQAAMGIAVRLGFAARLERDSDAASASSFDQLNIRENEEEDETEADRSVGKNLFSSVSVQGDAHSMAVLVDAETTSFLMMGLLSSGIKRHAVTLFEGGRVTGEEVISHLISELRTSADVKQQDEEIRKLMQTASSLAELLECVKEASGNGSIELLRRESLEGLSSEAVTRVLSHSYKAIVPVAPLSGDPLPLDSTESTPLFFGPTGTVASLWFQLACYAHLKMGPVSYVFLKGQRVTQLPGSLKKHPFALLSSFPYCKAPHLISLPFILHHVNELCRCGHVMVQPLVVDASREADLDKIDDLEFVDVPIPIALHQSGGGFTVKGFNWRSGAPVTIPIDDTLPELLLTLGLVYALGFIRFAPNDVAEKPYVPFHVYLGIPLSPLSLCNELCAIAREKNLLDPSQAQLVIEDQNKRLGHVHALIEEYSQSGRVLAPWKTFLFDGEQLRFSDDAPSDILTGGRAANEITPTVRRQVSLSESRLSDMDFEQSLI